jgi:toxin ParE1/3/4
VSNKLIIEPQALNEFVNGFLHYEHERPGLGEEFESALQDTYASILKSPNAFPLTPFKARKASVRGFPYKVVYVQRDFGLIVVSIFHTARDPKTWLKRIK